MPTFLLGLAALVVVLWLLGQFRTASPAKMAKATRLAGGVGGMAGAVLLALRGQLPLAALLAGFALWLLGKNRNPFAGLGGFANFDWSGMGRRAGAGRSSQVRSAMLDMRLDLDTGAMKGTVLAGRFEGRALDSMNGAELGELLAECGRVDPEGERLLEAYLDRRFAGGRATGERDADPRGRGPAGGRARPGGMSEQEAYEVLGLAPGAARDEVARAHRELMKKLHPDAGGSTHLAARVNEAKDVLMRRHY